MDVNEEKKPRKRGRPVNQKELREAFCMIYATRGDLPAGRCAVEAGYAPSSASNTASGLLKVPEVQARISQIIESGEYNCVVRKPKKERTKLYSAYYEQAYHLKYRELREGLGHHVRYCLDERYNRTIRWKDRKEGHLTHRIIHKQAVQFAMEYCNSLFGNLNRKKPRFNKYVRKDVY